MTNQSVAAADLWFRRYQRTAEPRVRLICFPHAGGAATVFRGWPALLPPDVELLAVRYPGRQDRFAEPCIESMEEMVDRVVPAVLPWLDRPVALFGHSMGAAIAHEVAGRLEHAHGVTPLVLFISGRAGGPFVATTAAYQGGDAALLAAVRRLDREQSDMFDHAELRALLLPSLRADYRLIETYRPLTGPVVNAPIVVYTGDVDPVCDQHKAQGWAAYTRGGLAVRVFPGDHFFLRLCEADVVSDLVSRLAEVTDPPSDS